MTATLKKGDTTTIDVVAATTIAENTFAFEGAILVFHSDAAVSGDNTEPIVNGTLKVEKTNTTDTYTVGADVNLDASTQKSVSSGGTKGGYAAKASANTDTYVWVRMNSV